MRNISLILIFLLSCSTQVCAQTYNYPTNDSVKACIKSYCDDKELQVKKVLKQKSLELVTDNNEFRIVSFNLVMLRSPGDISFMETVKGSKMNNYHIGFLKGAVTEMTINSIVASNKQGKCFFLKDVHYKVEQ